jgi:arginyl-tRNA synthetase
LKSRIAELVDRAIAGIPELMGAPEVMSTRTTVERTRDPRHGDFSTNIAMRLAKTAGSAPRDLAGKIIALFPESELVAKVEIAGPGFINIHLSDTALQRELAEVLKAGERYGRQEMRKEPRILLEFVSANPTGPLHVGHGRHAAYGATLGNLLQAAGYPVECEYYVNDEGRQRVAAHARGTRRDRNVPPGRLPGRIHSGCRARPGAFRITRSDGRGTAEAPAGGRA